MNLHQCFLTNNDCYKAGAKMVPQGIMVHSTGANNPNLRRYVGPDDGLLGKNTNGNTWNQPRPGGKKVCVHGFIGKLEDGSVGSYQTLPWDMQGWHAGGTANKSYIGFEICEDGLSDADYFAKVYREAVDLCVYLCRKYNLTEKNIICHCEGHALGIASNHADVMHWFPKHGKSMDTFRAEVRDALAGSERPEEPPTESPAPSFTPYRVRVTSSTLRIRKEPGTNHATQGRYTGQGVFTIVDEADGPGATKWGLLKAYQAKRNGWISLDFAEKL